MGNQPSIRVLGSIEVDSDRGPVALGPHQQMLLAVLAANPGSVVSTDVLVDAIWADDVAVDRSGALHSLVSRLRPRLPDGALVTRSPGYALTGDTSVLDLTRMEHLVRTAASCAPAEALTMLEEATALWRGPAFGEAADREPVHLRAIELNELRTAIDERRARALLDLGRPAEAAVIVEVLIEQHPYREQPMALVMEALARSGRPTDALHRYSAFRDRLAEETGLDPSADLRLVHQAVLNDAFSAEEPGPLRATRSRTAESSIRFPLRLRPSAVERRPGEPIAYASIGSGPPLLFMPGWISSLDAFADGTDPRSALLARLADDFTVTVFDRYGTGLSAASDVDTSLDASVDEIRALLDVIHGAPTVYAASAAGPAALRAAAGNPAVGRLVLLCTYANGPALFTNTRNKENLIDLVERSWGMGSRILADMIVPGIDAVTRSSFARFQRQTADPHVAAGYIRQLYEANATEALARIEQPCLILHYRDDPAIPYAGSRQLALGIPNTELRPLNGPYHTPPTDHVELIAATIRQFAAPT